MEYRNIKTGAIIDVPSEINDKNWELYVPSSTLVKQEVKEEAPKEENKVVKATKKAGKTATIHPRKKKEG